MADNDRHEIARLRGKLEELTKELGVITGEVTPEPTIIDKGATFGKGLLERAQRGLGSVVQGTKDFAVNTMKAGEERSMRQDIENLAAMQERLEKMAKENPNSPEVAALTQECTKSLADIKRQYGL
jgi:hypothetical protein